MANRIKGITIQIGADTTDLTKALRQVNSTIASTQASLKDVNRLLKLDPSNTELLTQRQKLLTESVNATKEKLETLKTAEQQAQEQFREGKISQEQYDALKREIIATEESLKDLEKQAAKSNATLSKIGAVADKVASGAGKVASATKGMSTAAAGALGGIVAAGYSAAVAADDLNTLAKQTGLSTETLQEAKYAADLIDVSYETFTGSINKMVGKLRTNEDGFHELGIATRNANGEMLSTEEIFWNAATALSAMENETERDIAAQELFGKSAAELAGILDDGGKAFREIGDEAKKSGIIMSQETLDGLNAVNDQIDTLKYKAKGALAVGGAKALEALTPVITKVIERITALLEKVGEMDQGQIQTILTILAVTAAISPLATGISKIASLVSFMTGTAIPALNTALTFLASNPIVLIIAAIVALVTLIATKGDEIQAILQKVDDFLQNIFAKDWTEVFGPVLGNVLNGFFANVKNIWDSIMQIFNGIIDFIRGVFTGDWQRAWEGVKSIFSGVFNSLISIAKMPINAIIGLINGLIAGINSMVRKINTIRITPPDWVTKLTGITTFGFNLKEIGTIPYLAKGGILQRGSAIVGEAGPELLTIMGNAARVQPLTNSTTNHNLGSVNITVNGAPGQDIRELAEIVMDEIQSATDRREAVFI